MQRAKLFAYVNNIQITWKTIHLSIFCRTNSPSTDQSRAEGNNTECVGKKRFSGSVTNGLRKEHVLRSPPLILDKVRSYMQIISHDTVIVVFSKSRDKCLKVKVKWRNYRV